jgi:SOS-response transcriptional repressor LexA|nr:hypothetical protein [uncultured bacterium]
MGKRTSTRDAILVFISAFREEYGISPTMREIAEGVGVSSPATIHRHIANLRKEGLLQDTAPCKSRNLVIKKQASITNGGEDADTHYICLKTNHGETVFVSCVANQGKISFTGKYFLKGAHNETGQIIACREINDSDYYSMLA